MVGLLLIGGTVFVVESIHVCSRRAVAKQRAAGGTTLTYVLFGREFDPLSAGTWAIPAAFFIAGGALLPLALRVTGRAWVRATQGAMQGEPA